VNCFSTQPIAREIILGQVGSVAFSLAALFSTQSAATAQTMLNGYKKFRS
jgi:Mn2+/Fe2+ NRAMP family transporter